ncbi:unnamed protein product [Orchesella dallaii]|uniref:Uncharacterized protein n=1 Tax=Orchesella dallaii TaxID=48710 RepID=A0ABP1R8I4_9HEXA
MSQTSVSMPLNQSTPSASAETGISEEIPPQLKQQEMINWNEYLVKTLDVQWICGVEYFRNAPLGGSKWQKYAKHGMVMEVPNPKMESTYWPAIVFGFAGYNALVEFVRVDPNERGSDGVRKLWIPFLSNVPKPLGYCLKNQILLYPVSKKDQQDPNFLEKTYLSLAERDLPTLKPNHWEYCLEQIKSTGKRFKVNEVVEALDKLNCGRNRMGLVTMTLANRIHVQYLDLNEDDEGFWFSQQSEHVHKLGWSHAVGSGIVGARSSIAYPLPDLSEFPLVPTGVSVEATDMFEMRHPVLLHTICVGFVIEPLRFGYFVAGTDWTRPDKCVKIVMHVTSDYILPINFCRKHNIDLKLPMKDGKPIMNFSWRKYLAELGFKALNLSAIKKEPARFTKGCKLEAVDLKQPTYLGPATVTDFAGHLIQIHFDRCPRTQESSFQWVSAESPDIYPACYSQAVGHKLACKPERPNPADLFYLADR